MGKYVRSDYTKVVKILKRYEELDLLEDRYEYTVKDLMESEGLNEPLATILYHNIQWRFASEEILRRDPQVTVDTLFEAIYQDFDGWSEVEKLIISAFLNDLSYAVQYLSTK